jgi:Tol biopolymer transport system component
MSSLVRKRIPAICLMVAAVCVYTFGGIFFRPHPAVGASGNGRIALTGMDDQSISQVYTMNADGSDIRQITNDTNGNYMPIWSFDGTKIAYTATDFSDQTQQVFVMRANGSHKVDISNDDNTQNAMARWSPDDSKLVYVSQPSDYSALPTINIMNADGSSKTTLTDASSIAQAPVWSPDGTKIAFICVDVQNVQQVCTMDTDGSNQQQLTSGTSTDYTSIAYSPDGMQFAYATMGHGGGYIQHLGIMNADGSNQHTVTTQNTSAADVNWSPDGTKLVYDNYDATENIQRVYYINTDGTGETVISPDNQYAFMPSWQPVSASDVDGDGILNTIEDAAPNSGDANGDSVTDKYQGNVTSIVSPVTSSYVAVQSDCASNTAVSAQTLPINYTDSAFRYPAGLVGFTLDCDNAGTTATVTQYFYGVSTVNTMVLRKYNSQTHTYSTIPGSTITATTIGGQTVTKVVYQVTDGGPFDQDGSANGTIVDPVGLAIPSVGTPNTGVGGTVLFPRNLAAPLL